MQKWEYCRLAYGGYWYQTVIGEDVETGKITDDYVDLDVISKLGEEGWEMVGSQYYPDDHTIIFFKRPIE